MEEAFLDRAVEQLLDGVDGLDGRGLAGRLQDAERAVRSLEAVKARLVGVAERTGRFRDDGHRSVRNWVLATISTRRSTADDLARLAALGAAHPAVIDALAGGRLPLAAAHAIARVHANPRVVDELAPLVDAFVTVGQRAPLHVLEAKLREWEQLADVDGPKPADGPEGRHGRCTTAGGVTFLDVRLSGAQGAAVKGVLEHFEEAEFRSEWAQLRTELGDAAEPGLLRRTVAQRCADAVVAIFERAAAAAPGAAPPVPVVDVVVSQAVFEEQLAAMIEDRPADFGEVAHDQRWCSTTNGVTVDPVVAVAAAMVGHVRRVVVDGTGRIIDLGRRQRLFRGASKEAAAIQQVLDHTGRRCLWPGCGRLRTQLDHIVDWQHGGCTTLHNEDWFCPPHNVLKSTGYTPWRDPDGIWHLAAPDGTTLDAA